MDLTVPQEALTELAPAYFQAAVTVGLAALCLVLYRRYRHAAFGVWAVAWLVYGARLGAIVSFLHTGEPAWLYWHQVTTGWTALVLLWAALVFSRRVPWKNVYALVALFPPVWSYVAIYRMDNFLLAAGPAVLFLSAATAWTAWVFWRYHREVGSPAARFLAMALLLWALHHLDYPFLRARGAWNPWGYYLDLVFELAMGVGILMLVLEDLDQGLWTLTSLSGELRGKRADADSFPEAVLRRALGLRGVHGSALWLVAGDGGAFVHGAGVCALWPHEGPPEAARRAVERVRATATPEVVNRPRPAVGVGAHAYTAALPVLRGEEVAGALVVVGEARDPFTVLDARFLEAFGQQVGAALENDHLYRNLEARTRELERLQGLMVQQHEEERDRLSRELHDETAQVLAALRMHLGQLRERGGASLTTGFDRAEELVAEGIRSIRSVTRNLRPIALDDLGLLPALRALARGFEADTRLAVEWDAPASLPEMDDDAELALYRAMQEALSNVARHSGGQRVRVSISVDAGCVGLVVEDDGVGLEGEDTALLSGRGGLAGMRERILGVGGAFELKNGEGGGLRLSVRVPSARERVADGGEKAT